MTVKETTTVYVPGAYPGRRSVREDLIAKYIADWEKQKRTRMRQIPEPAPAEVEIPPCITFSRKIGVGTQQIADRVARSLNLRVADREVIEEIAGRSQINTRAVAYFDERFPGYVNRTFKYLFGEKAFIDSDYARQLIAGVNAMAAVASTVFVGRGAHLILPRHRVLAIRCIGSNAYRLQRIAAMTGLTPTEAGKRLREIDQEQTVFFKKVFGKKDASPYEFDLVVNLDHLKDPELVADLVVEAFRRKFPEA